MALLNIFEKDPDAILDYTWDWNNAQVGPYLDTGEIILSSVVNVPAGLTKVSESNTTTKSTVWVSGGVAGNSYIVSCRVTTSGGRTDDRSIIIKVKDM